MKKNQQHTFIVTGASGTIGSSLVRSITKKGFSVLALTRVVKEDIANQNIRWIECDPSSEKIEEMEKNLSKSITSCKQKCEGWGFNFKQSTTK